MVLNIRINTTNQHFQSLVAVASTVPVEVKIDYLQFFSQLALKYMTDIFTGQHSLLRFLVAEQINALN